MPDFAPLYEYLTVYEFLDLFAASYFIPRALRKPTIERPILSTVTLARATIGN